jgi:hypothetical protein
MTKQPRLPKKEEAAFWIFSQASSATVTNEFSECRPTDSTLAMVPSVRGRPKIRETKKWWFKIASL